MLSKMVKYRLSENCKENENLKQLRPGCEVERAVNGNASDLDFFFFFSCCYGNLGIKLQMSGVLTDLNGKDSESSQGI